MTEYKDEEMIKIKYIISDYIFKTSGARHITKEEISKSLLLFLLIPVTIFAHLKKVLLVY